MTAKVHEIWAALDRRRRELSTTTLRAAFAADPARFDRFSARHRSARGTSARDTSAQTGGLLIDYSKCLVDADAMVHLRDLAEATGVGRRRDAMFAGEIINATEQRAVLHVALRNRADRPILVNGRDVMGDVEAMLQRLGAFAEAIRTGGKTGVSGRQFTDVLNIGIGGSDLGPAMATAALSAFHNGPRLHFVSNIDGAHLSDTLARLDPATTLMIVASKTFTTIETMTNAASARSWLVERLGEAAVATHFVAVSSAIDKAAAFGIPPQRVFGFWDWVGGRYSVWSAIGLSLMIAIGAKSFGEFLAGARDMDEHFRAAEFDCNLPMLLGMIGVWHRAVCGYPTRAIIPYSQRLARLPAFLQQLEMESNGKSVDSDGRALQRAIGAVVWGAAGTDAQHSFFQLLHQGQDTIPVEFLVAASGHEAGLEHHHRLLVANCLAQSEALALGRSCDEAKHVLRTQGRNEADAERLAPHKTFAGNRPSLTILFDRLDPFVLGQLIALYEHRVFVEAAVHGINAYDQWGVELGKELAVELAPMVAGTASTEGRNGSTRGLVEAIRQRTAAT